MANRGTIGPDSWDRERLFRHGDRTLQEMMGVLLRVPELRNNLNDVLGGRAADGDKLALILKDWVNGDELTTIAANHFRKDGEDEGTALTKCGQNLFGKLAQTSAWGLNALLAITTSDLPDDERKRLANVPSQVFYGVATDEAVALRLLGVPRRAATRLAGALNLRAEEPLSSIRRRLATLPEQDWLAAVGPAGGAYRRAWQIMDGAVE
jgi:hypothetical protein